MTIIFLNLIETLNSSKEKHKMKKFKILIIDDNVLSGNALKEILTANDFDAECAVDQKEAYRLLNLGTIDLIFLSLLTNKRYSTSICRQIKSDSKFHKIPLLFILQHKDLLFIKDIYDDGGDDFVLTPLVWSELLMKIRIHLELRYSREIAKNTHRMLEENVSKRTVELMASLEELKQAKKDLELLSIAKSEFLNLMSHEIRTPLNGILGSLALIGRHQFSDEVNRYLSLLDISVKRLERFSNMILESSNLRLKGRNMLICNKLNLDELIHKAIDQCKIKFLDKSINVIIHNEATHQLVMGDARYLLKCLVAIIDNAFKFSPSKGVVEIRTWNETKDQLKFSISDYGKGFSESALANIYKPLSNLESHFDQNTGMGLHMAKLIVDAHAGSITAENHAPHGAIIEITLPQFDTLLN